MTAQELYGVDFFEWAKRNAELLSQGCFESADIPHIVEELDGLAERDRREVKSYLRRLMMHLLKWQFQPDPRTKSWLGSIGDSRSELDGIFEQSPSLRRFASESFGDVYPRARREAARETGMPPTAFPEECPYRFDQLMDEDFLPTE